MRSDLLLAGSPPLEILRKTQAVSYSEVAAVTVLTWDIIVTLSEEIELIWQKQWSPAKIMYVIARYLPWAFQMALLAINVNGSTGLHFSISECKKWMAVQAVILQLIVTSVDVILLMRVYALFNKNKRLLSVLSALFVAELTLLSYILAVITPKLTFSDTCFVTSSPPFFVAYWVVSLVFETILFVLTLYKFGYAVQQGWGRRPVMKEFVADGTWAYTLIFVSMFINSMLYKFVHSPLAGICFTWLLSVLSFAGSRIILNPRRRTNARSSHSGPSIQLISIPLSPLSPNPLITPTSARSFPGLPSPARSNRERYTVNFTQYSSPTQDTRSDRGIAI